MNFDSGQHPRNMRDKTRNRVQTQAPQAFGKPMQNQCVNSRITQDDFENGAGGRIPAANRENIVTKVFKEWHSKRSRPERLDTLLRQGRLTHESRAR
jgi:hypothetical protein